MIDKKNYLAGTTRPDIIFSVHKYAKYSIYPEQSHEDVVKTFGRYFKNAKEKSLGFTPDGTNGLECYANVDFSGVLCR